MAIFKGKLLVYHRVSTLQHINSPLPRLGPGSTGSPCRIAAVSSVKASVQRSALWQALILPRQGVSVVQNGWLIYGVPQLGEPTMDL